MSLQTIWPRRQPARVAVALSSQASSCLRMQGRSRPCTALYLSASLRRHQSTAPSSHPPPEESPGGLQEQQQEPKLPDVKQNQKKKDLYENIYTWPNLITLSRIASTPLLGYFIVTNQTLPATVALAYAGISDIVDGWLARRFNMGSVMGSILDPAADKFLMTTLTVTLTMNGSLPLPLAVLIIGRDAALSLSAFYWRYITLAPPKTFVRFWDFSIPSAEVRPTAISKYNTFLQLSLMGVTTIAPLLPLELGAFLTGFQWLVGGTTIWSGLSYVGSQGARAVQ